MYTTDGIILKRIDVGEAGAFFTLYTKEFGKMRALAQGVKKEGAKLKGHLELLSLSTVIFVLGKNGERLTHSMLQNFWHGVRSDLEKLRAAHYLANLVDNNCMPGEKDEALWNLLLASFIELDHAGAIDKNFIQSFEIQFIRALGYTGERDIRILR